MQKEIDNTGEDMLYLITCALHNQTPDIKKVGDMDFEALYRYAKRHTLAAITYDALELLGESTGDGPHALSKDDEAVTLHKIQGNENRITKNTKAKYIIGRLFPPMSYYKAYYPYIYKTRIFIPFFVIFRMVRGVLQNGKKLMREVKVVLKIDQADN